jgi:hypothetical protein
VKTAQESGSALARTAATGTAVQAVSVPAVPVKISSTQFNAPGDDRLNLNGEYIVLTNRGDEPVLLAGWTLSDNGGSVRYRFPAFVLMPDASVTVYSGTGMTNDTALFMGKEAPVWGNSGDEAVLKDAFGSVIDRRTEGAQG